MLIYLKRLKGRLAATLLSIIIIFTFLFLRLILKNESPTAFDSADGRTVIIFAIFALVILLLVGSMWLLSWPIWFFRNSEHSANDLGFIGFKSFRLERNWRSPSDVACYKKAGLLDLMQKLASAANDEDQPLRLLELCTTEICAFGKWSLGQAYLRNESSVFRSVCCVSRWLSSKTNDISDLQQPCENLAVQLEKYLADSEIIWVTNLHALCDLDRSVKAAHHGFKTGIWLPVKLDEEVLCVFEFLCEEIVPTDHHIAKALTQIATQVARVFERQRVAKALLESEDRFRLFSSLADEGIIIHRDGLILEANSASYAITLMKPEEIVGTHISQYLDKSHHQKILELISINDEVRTEVTINRYDSTTLDVEVHGKKIIYHGSPARVALVRDITRQKMARKLLIESEERFRRLSEAAFEAVVIHKDGIIAEVNSAFLNMLGYSDCCEVVGTNVLCMVASAFYGIASDRVKNHDPSHYQIEMVRKDGAIICVEVRARMIPYDDGIARVATLNDITDQKRTEEILREREARLSLLVEQMPAVLWSVDRNLLLTSMTGAGLRLMDAEPGLHGTHVSMLFDEPHSSIVEYHRQTLLGEPQSFDMKWCKRTMEAHLEPMRNRENQITGVIGMALDITERKLSEEKIKLVATELQRSNRELEQFAYVASHDLQEPLRMIASYMELLSRRYHGRFDKDADEYIGYAVDGAKHMKQQIDGLLTYSRVNRVGSEFSYLDCHDILKTVLRNLKLLIDESGACINLKGLPTSVFADVSQMGLLFQNLISNALKFRSDRKLIIDISSESKSSEWLFCISDNGIGFDMEYADRIFYIFQRLHTASEYPGTGIGLAICKKIIENHGGSIWVYSLKDQGSKFYFTMPKAMDVV